MPNSKMLISGFCTLFVRPIARRVIQFLRAERKMQTLLLVSVLLGLLMQRSLARLLDDRCGMAVTGRVSNGRNAEQEAAAWMAGIRNEEKFLCGGTLIHKRFVLTAAHCIEGHGRLFVKLGAYNISLPAVEFSVSHAEVHREYSRETLQNDIGLLKLPLEVVSTEQIYPICINLPPTTQTEAENASTFDAYGWGKTQTANMSEILQRVTLERYDHSRCNEILYSPLTSNQICAGSSNRDTCHGDSGGPLIKELDYNGIKRLTQIGMVSYGLSSCTGLGIYTDIARYAEWIEEKIKALFPQYSWPPSSSAAAIARPVSISPPPENFNRAQLLVEPCGTAVRARIHNSLSAEPDAAAWMAAVHNKDELKCGSTVIHRRFVLTAASCIYYNADEDLFVNLGAYNIWHPTLEYNVTKRIKHDEYNPVNNTNNIGLLQLSGDIPFGRSIYPICIILNPEVKSKVENAYTYEVYGWGGKNVASDRLQRVTLYRYYRSVCNRKSGIPLNSSDICAGASVERFDRGDLGVPLTNKFLVNGLQRQTQFGILSGGGTAIRSVISTDVTSYVDWIVRNVRGNGSLNDK